MRKLNKVLIVLISLFILAKVAYAQVSSSKGQARQEADLIIKYPKDNCPLPDPYIRLSEQPLAFALPPIVEVIGGGYTKNVLINGLSTLHFKMGVFILQQKAAFDLNIGHLDSTAAYKAKGYMDGTPMPPETVRSGNFSGLGQSRIYLDNLVVKGRAVFETSFQMKVTLAKLTFSEIRYDKLKVDLENFDVNEKAVDWVEFNRDNKANFDRDWKVHGDAVTEKIRLAINDVIKNTSKDEIITRLKEMQGEDECSSFPTEAPTEIEINEIFGGLVGISPQGTGSIPPGHYPTSSIGAYFVFACFIFIAVMVVIFTYRYLRKSSLQVITH